MKTGIVIFAHGSSVASANDAVREVAQTTARKAQFELFETAFLEGGRPDLREAVDSLVRNGASRILVIPYFLTLGLHLQRDLPAIVRNISSIHTGVDIRVTPPLDGHPALARILEDRAREALASDGRN